MNEPALTSQLPTLPLRSPDGHKGSYGSALLIGGSLGMTGAISLSGMAALRAGAGRVRVATPQVCQSTVAQFEPCYMTIGLAADAAGRIATAAHDPIDEAASAATAIGCGPGLGQSDDLTELVAWLYTSLRQTLVVDADALNALAKRPEILQKPGGPRILTPHPGEMARLVGIDKVPDGERETLARQLAERTQAVVVLKGHRTVIAEARKIALNATGNPGMATGGTGDVLTGVITAFVCQGLTPFDAARLGTHVHGLAGDLAARERGQVGLVARDLVELLPRAISEMQSTQHKVAAT